MHDSHCHLDQIVEPERIAIEFEAAKVRLVAVTNTPDHYSSAIEPLSGFRWVRPALGLHPMMATRRNERYLRSFRKLLPQADFIGEVGLEFSDPKAPHHDDQIWFMQEILRSLNDGRRRFLSFHSRGAEDQLLDILESSGIGPVVFHWFTGTLPQLRRLISLGHFLSLNIRMTKTKTWPELCRLAPKNRILLESDAPHAVPKPAMVSGVAVALASAWEIPVEMVEQTLDANLASVWVDNSN